MIETKQRTFSVVA